MKMFGRRFGLRWVRRRVSAPANDNALLLTEGGDELLLTEGGDPLLLTEA